MNEKFHQAARNFFREKVTSQYPLEIVERGNALERLPMLLEEKDRPVVVTANHEELRDTVDVLDGYIFTRPELNNRHITAPMAHHHFMTLRPFLGVLCGALDITLLPTVTPHAVEVYSDKGSISLANIFRGRSKKPKLGDGLFDYRGHMKSAFENNHIIPVAPEAQRKKNQHQTQDAVLPTMGLVFSFAGSKDFIVVQLGLVVPPDSTDLNFFKGKSTHTLLIGDANTKQEIINNIQERIEYRGKKLRDVITDYFTSTTQELVENYKREMNLL